MTFTVTRRFREIEKADPRVGRLQSLDGGTNRVIDAVPDDENFDVIDALRLHARDCERQGCGAAAMGRNENASCGHRVQSRSCCGRALILPSARDAVAPARRQPQGTSGLRVAPPHGRGAMGSTSDAPSPLLTVEPRRTEPGAMAIGTG